MSSSVILNYTFHQSVLKHSQYIPVSVRLAGFYHGHVQQNMSIFLILCMIPLFRIACRHPEQFIYTVYICRYFSVIAQIYNGPLFSYMISVIFLTACAIEMNPFEFPWVVGIGAILLVIITIHYKDLSFCQPVFLSPVQGITSSR